MKELLEPQARYEIRPSGHFHAHDGFLVGKLFDGHEHAIQVLKSAEKIAGKLEQAVKMTSVPVTVFSTAEIALGLKNKNLKKIATGLIGVGVVIGLIKTGNYIEEVKDQANVEIEDIQDLISSGS